VPEQKKENLKSEANERLRDKALDYIRRYSSDGEEMRQNREDSLKAYRRDPYKEDARIPEGSRSKFVMSDFADTVEWILPSLARIFYSGKEVVKIEGRGPEDTRGAELLNNKVNWDITVQNNGFLIFYDWFKASMLNRHSEVKYWWETRDEYREQNYEGVTAEQLEVLRQDPKYQVESIEEKVGVDFGETAPDPMMGMMPPTQASMFDVKGKILKRRIRRPVAEVVPPEEIICNIKMRNIKDEEFVAHRLKKHKVELKEKYGVKEDDLLEEAMIFNQSDSELYERFKDIGGVGFFQDEDDDDFYYIYECAMKDEKREPIFLTIMGTRVIDKKPNTYGHPNYCMVSPIRMPHRAIGVSVYDLVGDLQKLRTALIRYILNNIYYQTENMLVVNEWKINLADFATQRRPGGVIRTKDASVIPSEAVYAIQPQPLAGHAYNLLNVTDSVKEKRTGVTSYNQGVDADSLNKTARGISEIMAASQQRVELIARIFAETGVRDLMTAFAEMNIEFLDIETNVRLDQGWLEIPDPKALDVQYDTTVDVALGTGSREMKAQQWGSVIDRSLNPIMISSGVVRPENVFEQMKTLLIEMGYKNVEKYITDPRTLMPQMPPGGPNGQPVNGSMGPGVGVPGLEGAGIPPNSGMVQ
jgi:hypothetical protein